MTSSLFTQLQKQQQQQQFQAHLQQQQMYQQQLSQQQHLQMFLRQQYQQHQQQKHQLQQQAQKQQLVQLTMTAPLSMLPPTCPELRNQQSLHGGYFDYSSGLRHDVIKSSSSSASSSSSSFFSPVDLTTTGQLLCNNTMTTTELHRLDTKTKMKSQYLAAGLQPPGGGQNDAKNKKIKMNASECVRGPGGEGMGGKWIENTAVGGRNGEEEEETGVEGSERIGVGRSESGVVGGSGGGGMDCVGGGGVEGSGGVGGRTLFARWQLEVLFITFSQSHYPSLAHRESLAQSLGIPEFKIQIWFQNQRAKWRKRENTRCAPGRPALRQPRLTCSGQPIPPDLVQQRQQQLATRKREQQQQRREERRRAREMKTLSLLQSKRSATSRDFLSGESGVSSRDSTDTTPGHLPSSTTSTSSRVQSSPRDLDQLPTSCKKIRNWPFNTRDYHQTSSTGDDDGVTQAGYLDFRHTAWNNPPTSAPMSFWNPIIPTLPTLTSSGARHVPVTSGEEKALNVSKCFERFECHPSRNENVLRPTSTWGNTRPPFPTNRPDVISSTSTELDGVFQLRIDARREDEDDSRGALPGYDDVLSVSDNDSLWGEVKSVRGREVEESVTSDSYHDIMTSPPRHSSTPNDCIDGVKEGKEEGEERAEGEEGGHEDVGESGVGMSLSGGGVEGVGVGVVECYYPPAGRRSLLMSYNTGTKHLAGVPVPDPWFTSATKELTDHRSSTIFINGNVKSGSSDTSNRLSFSIDRILS